MYVTNVAKKCKSVLKILPFKRSLFQSIWNSVKTHCSHCFTWSKFAVINLVSYCVEYECGESTHSRRGLVPWSSTKGRSDQVVKGRWWLFGKYLSTHRLSHNVQKITGGSVRTFCVCISANKNDWVFFVTL